MVGIRIIVIIMMFNQSHWIYNDYDSYHQCQHMLFYAPDVCLRVRWVRLSMRADDSWAPTPQEPPRGLCDNPRWPHICGMSTVCPGLLDVYMAFIYFIGMAGIWMVPCMDLLAFG